MLIVNFNRLFVAEALQDTTHPMHVYAKEYDKGIRDLNKRYPEGTITFKSAVEEPTVDMIDSKGKEYRDVPEGAKPVAISLRANVAHPTRGTEYWGVCTGTPYLIREGVWDIGDKLSKKSKLIEGGSLTVNLKTEADLAFFLYFKCPLITGGHWKIDDPKADIRAKGDEERAALSLRTAIWQTLGDEDTLRLVASAYGIDNVETKEADAIRFELRDTLERNNKLKSSDPTYKGTEEFMEDLKITDYILLCAFIKHFLNIKAITWRPDGRYKIGDKTIAQVPADWVKRKFEWLCNHLASPNNLEKLQSLMIDVVNEEYLDSIKEDKIFRWIAKVKDIQGYYNKSAEVVRELVYVDFGIHEPTAEEPVVTVKEEVVATTGYAVAEPTPPPSDELIQKLVQAELAKIKPKAPPRKKRKAKTNSKTKGT
jgi:hypothetical protein